MDTESPQQCQTVTLQLEFYFGEEEGYPGENTKVHLPVITETYVAHILLFLSAVPDLFDASLCNIWSVR